MCHYIGRTKAKEGFYPLLLPFLLLALTSHRKLPIEKTLAMGILNLTPDSFSDGGKVFSIDEALRQAEKIISEEFFRHKEMADQH